MIFKNLIISVFLILLVSCSNADKRNADSDKKWEHKIKVEEVIQTSSYTYLLVEENGRSRWIAVSSIDATEGDVLYYNNGLEMVDFKSRELNKVFPNLLLVQIISDGKSEVLSRKVPKKKLNITQHNSPKIFE